MSEVSIRSDLKPDIPLFRFVSKAELSCILSKHQIRLTRAILWYDQDERELVDQWKSECGIERRNAEQVGMKRLASVKDWVRTQYLPHEEQQLYASCWTASLSDKMWRKYSPDCGGVAIQTTAGKLSNSLASFHLPAWERCEALLLPVSYLAKGEKPNYRAVGLNGNVHHMFFFKDKVKYDFENEVRAAIVPIPVYPDERRPPDVLPPPTVSCEQDHLYCPIQRDFIERAFVDERTDDVTKALLMRFEIPFEPFKNPKSGSVE